MEEVAVYWQEGRNDARLFVKADVAPDGARRRFPGSRGELAKHWVIDAPNAEVVGTELLRAGRVSNAWLAALPPRPPSDLDPLTPDFRDEQGWLDPFPGLGFDEAARFPGGNGENVRIADIEYSWDRDHEDLGATLDSVEWGWEWGEFRFHGNGVLGALVGGHNGYGIDGGAPFAEPLIVHPFVSDFESYDVAAAIVAATDLLDVGDVILIEQQGYVDDNFCPVSYDEGVYDAIVAAVDAGLVVIEPGGNGGADLDAVGWGGVFDRTHDSGSIMVGTGDPPDAAVPRAWSGSSYGARLDVQAWGSNIATAGSSDGYNDLYFPGDDYRQAYTGYFGGTSGASAIIAAMAGVIQSVAIANWGVPIPPRQLREMMVASGSPQAYGQQRVGPQPDLRRILRTWLVP